MNYLGIDYGKSKIGLAVGDGEVRLAEPLKVLHVENLEDALQKAEEEIREMSVSKIIVGVSEGKMEKDSRRFGQKLQERVEVGVVFQDETLTTHDAHIKSIEAGLKRKKRKEMEDAYAAAVILQAYLDRI